MKDGTLLKPGERLYHALFGMCTVFMPTASHSTRACVDLDADELSYYVMGQGYVSYKRQGGHNILTAPIDEFFRDKADMANLPIEERQRLALMKGALNPTITMWPKETV